MKKTDSSPKTRIQTLGVDPISLSRELLFQGTIRKPKHRRNVFLWLAQNILAKQLNHATTYLSTPCGNHTIETFSIMFSWQTADCHVTTALRSRSPLNPGRASSGKWFTAMFFAIKNCTASRLKARTWFLYQFAKYLLDFRSRINELFLFFERWKWCTSTWWKTTWRH